MDHKTLRQSAAERPAPRRALSLWTSRDKTTSLPVSRPGDGFVSEHDNEALWQQRGDNVNRLLAACSAPPVEGRPQNAADLAVTLVNLVFPYDVRNMQRSLARLENRMLAVEAKGKDKDTASLRREQGLKMIRSEMATVQSLDEKIIRRPKPQADLVAGIQEIGTKIISKTADNDQNKHQALQITQSMLAQLRGLEARMQRQSTKNPQETTVVNADIDDMSTESEDDEAMTKMSITAPHGISDVPQNHHGSEEEALDRPDMVHDGQTPIREANDIGDQKDARLRPRHVMVNTAATTRDAASKLATPRSWGRARQTKPSQRASPKEFERRTTESNGIARQSPTRQSPRVPARRLAFTAYTKHTDLRFRAQKPEGKRCHTEFVWEYIDNMEDKDMSAAVQQMMSVQFPGDVSKSKGRGKPGRQVRINGAVEWPQLLAAIKSMPIPDCLQNNREDN